MGEITIDWEEGTYTGEVSNNVPNGEGTYTFNDGDKYVGEFRGGKFNGQGTGIRPDGTQYVGEFKNGEYNGQGIYTYDERIKSSRLKKELKLVQSSIAEVETDNLLKKYDDAVYQQIKKNLAAEMKTKKDGLEQSRIRSKELGNHQSWLDWIGKYGDDLTLKSELPKEDRKEYLHGLLDRIEVTLDQDTLDHELQVFFRLGLVGDGIEYVNPKRKSDGYQVVEGKKKTSVVITSGRKKQVKKNEQSCPRTKIFRYSRVVRSWVGQRPTASMDYAILLRFVRYFLFH